MLVWLLLTVLNINHLTVDCVVKGQSSRIVANVEPSADVATVRLYFKSTEGEDYFFVPMTFQRGEYGGRLPKPKSGRMNYYIEAHGADGTLERTAEMTASIVKDQKSCPSGGRVAESATNEAVPVNATTPSLGKPKGFDGVATVTPTAGKDRSARASEQGKPPSEKKPAGHEPASPSPGEGAGPLAAKAEAPAEYLIGPADILRIVVYGHETLTQTVIVQQDGTFTFPLIGRVKGSDLAPDELQRKIATLLAKDFIRNPQVTVNVQEYRSKTVFVVGQIAKPGRYPLEGNTTVVSILAKAGPTTGNAVEVVVVRPLVEVSGPLLPTELAPDAPKATVMRISLRDIEAGLLDKNLVLQPNDTVFIPQAQPIYVSGEVAGPGAYPFAPGMTVRQAISLAGGFTERSSNRIRVVRVVDGKPQEIKIRLDDPVEAGDALMVKEKFF